MTQVVILLIRIYQRGISPWLPPVCRVYPSGSQYQIDALAKYGIFKGVFLGVCRLFKCHPFHPGGYDPLR